MHERFTWKTVVQNHLWSRVRTEESQQNPVKESMDFLYQVTQSLTWHKNPILLNAEISILINLLLENIVRPYNFPAFKIESRCENRVQTLSTDSDKDSRDVEGERDMR
jgi:hypothetical protein